MIERRYSTEVPRSNRRREELITVRATVPVSVTITGVRDSDYYKNQKYVSEVTYSKVNSGIHVDIPSGIDNPIYQ